MSLFSERISWNEIKKLVASFTGRTVVGDGEAKLLHFTDLIAIQVARDHQYVYFGDIHINTDPFGDVHLIQYENEQGTATDTYKRDATGLETPGSITNDVIFNKVAIIPYTEGQMHILAYKIELKTDLGTVYNYSDATLPVTGWSKAGTTYTHAAGTANTLSFALSLPAGNYIMYATANITAGQVTFSTDELGTLIVLSGVGSQSDSCEFYSTGTGSILGVIPDVTFVGSFTEANIYIQQVIYS